MKAVMFRRLFFLVSMLGILSSTLLFAADNSGVPPLKESKAYEQFKLRPVTDFSKLVYLIDRFSSLKLEVVYDGHYFNAAFAGRIAKWFLGVNYKNQKPDQWIMQWCNTSVPAGNIIYVKMPNNKFRLSREVLFDEIKALDKAIEEDHLVEPKKPELNLTANKQLMIVAPPNAAVPAEAQVGKK